VSSPTSSSSPSFAAPDPLRLAACRAGDELWGDDLDEAGIAAWYSDEEQAYREMKEARVARGEVKKGHQYGTANWLLAFKGLPPGPLGDALAVGGYDGSEMKPLWTRLRSLTVLDPAYAELEEETREGLTVRFEAPAANGLMRFPDASFDLTTALSVLHHIPNVSTVLSEMVRVTRPGGHVIVSEPLVSMGDFTRPRPGLTPHERGLPIAWLDRTVASLPVRVLERTLWRFPLTTPLAHALGVPSPYNTAAFVRLDLALSRLTRWNLRYTRTSKLQKVAPGAVFLVLQRL
jgi:SAM-dependent methyltransferase